ncbi:unnamed protein product [Closterium sp. NIES-65]|nr:unnamed protein product [Closterium sp. NIES-65]
MYVTYLKCEQVVTEFLSLLTVDKAYAASLQDVLLTHLHAIGLNRDEHPIKELAFTLELPSILQGEARPAGSAGNDNRQACAIPSHPLFLHPLFSLPPPFLTALTAGSGCLLAWEKESTVQAELQTRSVKGKERGSGKESQGSIRRVGDEEGGETGGEDVSDARRAGNVGGKSEGGGSKSCRTKGCKEEEEEAVAVIAGVLREKFGPQIVKEELEERGSGIGSSEGEEGVGRLKVEEGDDEEEEEVEEEEAEVEPCEENAPPTTSPSTPPPPLNSRRVVSRSSLLSLYRFFSSHLGISSPSIVSSLLATYPQLLRSNPTNDFLPRVRLLQSYGISDADIAHMTLSNPAWLRSSLPQIQNMLELLLGKGIRRSRLGLVLRRGRNLLCREARSTNLDILVEKAGVPVDKLGGIIEKCPSILARSKETMNTQLEMLSAYLKAKSGRKVEAGITSKSPLKQRLDEPHLDKSHLSRLILNFPIIFSYSPYRIAENIAILQSFTPPGSSSIASSVLRRGPNIIGFNKETLLAKLQFFVELVGEEAAGRMVRSFSQVLYLSKENVEGKVAVLADLIGQENALRVVAQFPLLLASSEDVMRETFRELVREVEEELRSSGEVGNGTQSLDRRIRPRHLALVRMGYAVVAHEIAIQTSVGDRRGVSIGAGKERSKLGSVSDEVEGVERIEWGAEEGKSGPLFGVVAASDEPGERVVTERQLLDLEGSKKMVCLQQFLLCTDKQFEEKFGVKV